MWNRPTVLLAVAMLGAASITAARPMISYRAVALDATTFEIGLIASAFGLLAVAGAVPIGRLADRYGGRPVAIAGTLTVAVTLSVLSMANTLGLLVVGQAFLGVGQLMLAIGCQTSLSMARDPGERKQLFGTYAAVVAIGHAIGPAVGGFVAGRAPGESGAAAVFLIGAATALVAVALAVGWSQQQRDATAADDLQKRVERTSILDTLARPGMRQAMLASVLILSAQDLLVAYLPVYGQARGISPELVGLAIGTLFLSQMPSRLMLGRLVTRFGILRILMASMGITAVLAPLLILPIGAVALMVIVALIGLNLGLGQPMTLLLVATASARGGQGLAMSLRMVGNRLGQLTLPALVGGTAGQAGVAGIIVALALMLGLGSVVLAADGGALGEDPVGEP